jgi:hypothetical protein
VKLAHEFSEFLLCAELGARDYLDVVFWREDRADLQQSRQVQLASGDGLDQQRKAFHQFRCAGASRRSVFREAKLVDAVRVKARAGTTAMNAARFDLCEVRQQCREDLIGRAD